MPIRRRYIPNKRRPVVPTYKIEWALDVTADDPITALEIARDRVNTHGIPATISTAAGTRVSPRDEQPKDFDVSAVTISTTKPQVPVYRNYGTPASTGGRERGDWIILAAVFVVVVVGAIIGGVLS